MINFSALSIDYLARPSRRWRASPSSLNEDGEMVPADPAGAWTNIRAVIQPTPGNVRKDLPEGLRDEADYCFWSRTEFKLDDVLEEGGQYFRVMHLQPRRDGGFFRAVGCKLAGAPDA